VNPLAIFQPKYAKAQALKERVLKNKEGVLDALSENIKGARTCPLLMGQKCLGSFCEMFLELKSVSNDGKEVKFWRCAYVETPLLLIELNQSIQKLTEIILNTNAPKT